MAEKTAVKKFKCAKCGKEKSEDEGMMIWGGTAFCCNVCCEKAKKNEEQDGVCEFC